MVAGHLTWGFHEPLTRARPHFYVTCLRNPLSTKASGYLYTGKLKYGSDEAKAIVLVRTKLQARVVRRSVVAGCGLGLGPPLPRVRQGSGGGVSPQRMPRLGGGWCGTGSSLISARRGSTSWLRSMR